MLCCPQVAAQNLQQWICKPCIWMAWTFGRLGSIQLLQLHTVWSGVAYAIYCLLLSLLPTSHTCFFVTAKHHQQTSILRIRTINHINHMSCGNLFHFLADFPIKIWVSTMKYCHPFSTSPWGSMGLDAPPPYTRGPKVSGVLGQRVLVPKLSGPRINQPSGIVL